MAVTKAEPRSEEAFLQEAVERLVATLDPEQIYLFGSRARGDFREGSDYDLMVIVPDNKPSQPEPTRVAYKALSGLPKDKDVKVWRHTYFYRQIHLKASMPTAVLRDGRLLYVKPGYEVNYEQNMPGQLLIREETSSSYDPVLIDNTRDWLKKARKDLLAADYELGGSDELLEDVMFHSQQAAEKAIKAFLTWHDQPFEKTHELGELGKYCESYDPTLVSIVTEVDWLSEWSVGGRYPGELPDPSRDLAEESLRAARRVFAEILNRLPKEVSPEPSTG